MSEVPAEATEETSVEIPEHLQAPIAELNDLRARNAEKLLKLDGMAKTDVRMSVAMTRLNMLVDAFVGDGENRLHFELAFENNVTPILEHYLSEVLKASLMQGVPGPGASGLIR